MRCGSGELQTKLFGIGEFWGLPPQRCGRIVRDSRTIGSRGERMGDPIISEHCFPLGRDGDVVLRRRIYRMTYEENEEDLLPSNRHARRSFRGEIAGQMRYREPVNYRHSL